MSSDRDDPNICNECVGDESYARWISEHGKQGKCGLNSNHGRKNPVVPVSAFAVEVDRHFRENYQWGGTEAYYPDDSDKASYEQRGNPLLDILANDLGCDDDVAEAISNHLPDVSDRDITQGAEPFYDSTMHYESIAEVEARDRADQEEFWFQERFSHQWEEFADQVKYYRRYFKTQELLDDLFGQQKEYEGPSITPIYELQAGQRIFRARILDDGFTEEMLNRNSVTELGTPPREKTRAGRMNVEFIPAFYGAFSEETAVAEMRPGIGERVAIGVFVVQRPIKVFDFTAFSHASHAGKTEQYDHTRYDFIVQVEREISRPILPYEKHREYIPTQIVAEYLKEFFACDAVIYGSSMVRARNVENRNIVILPGRPFLDSADAVLRYESHRVKTVHDVTYQLIDDIF